MCVQENKVTKYYVIRVTDNKKLLIKVLTTIIIPILFPCPWIPSANKWNGEWYQSKRIPEKSN